MLAATDYPFLDILWTMIIFFAWVAWIWIAITVFGDVFRRDDISGWGKAAWTVFVILLPFLGVLVYLIGNGKGMAERHQNAQRVARGEFDDYVKNVAADSGPAGQIEKAKGLLDRGTITPSEFDTLKAEALGSSARAPSPAVH